MTQPNRTPAAGEVQAGEPAVPSEDSPKRHGDALGVVATPPVGSKPTTGPSGDSPKPHGDKLEHATAEAAGRS